MGEKYQKLDEKYGMIDNPPFMNGRSLYPHQRTVVKAALDLESKCYYKKKDFLIISNALCITMEFGSGKTLITLSIALSRNEQAFPALNIPNVIKFDNTNYRDSEIINANNFVVVKYKRVIDVNFIVVNRNIINPYLNAIKEFAPSARVLLLDNAIDLQKFELNFTNNALYLESNYDIVLIKAGTSVGSFMFSENNSSQKEILNTISLIIHGYCVKRVFYDDVDIVHFSDLVLEIPAVMTYYVSASRNERQISREKSPNMNPNNKLYLMNREYMLNINKYDDLYKYFNLCVTKEYLDKSLRVPKYKAFKYVYSNPDDNTIKLIGVLGKEETEQVIELINGDAIGAAAATLGIVTHTVMDIFAKLLGSKYMDFKKHNAIVKNLDDTAEYNASLPEDEETPDISKKECEKIIDNARSMLISERYMSYLKKHLDIKSDNLSRSVDEYKPIHKKQLNEASIAIDRVRDNIAEGSCQVCASPFVDEDEKMNIIINRCCGVILCDDCGIKSAKIRKRGEMNGEIKFSGKCPNCSREIDIMNGMIFINKDFDISSITNNTNIHKESEEELKMIEEEEKRKQDTNIGKEEIMRKLESIKSPKQKALMAILNNVEIKESTEIQWQVSKLMQGREYIEQKRGKKVLLFASQKESIKMLETFLEEQKIPHLTLQGKSDQITKLIEKFRDSDGVVLIINMRENCAGLNIEFATDIIFYHKINNHAIESQVAGRGQRIGRVDSLNIHFLLYENEKDDKTAKDDE